MKLTAGEHRELERLFVHTTRDGQRRVGHRITTNATRTRIATLHALTRKGFIRYEDNEVFRACFGVVTWDVEVTDQGRAYLLGAAT